MLYPGPAKSFVVFQTPPPKESDKKTETILIYSQSDHKTSGGRIGFFCVHLILWGAGFWTTRLLAVPG